MEPRKRHPIDVLALVFCLLMLISIRSYGSEKDIACLKSIKGSLQDPNGYLNSSWDFTNETKGFICNFIGIVCWHKDDNRVFSIQLSGMGLKGDFPRGVANCTSVTGLDLSSNNLSGEIPSDISHLVPYVITLVLSSNEFSGEIPASISNCIFLNKLELDQNRLTGHIPPQIGQLRRLQSFNVASNLLSGPIPRFVNGYFDPECFADNQGLCGPPLADCPSLTKKPMTGIIAGAAAGGVTLKAVALVGVYFIVRRVPVLKKKREDRDPEGNEWAKAMRGTKGVKVSLFEDSVSEIKLSELMKATNNFSRGSIIGMGRTGTLYKATLKDGSVYTVKRLQDSRHSEKEFTSEMATLGEVRHSNLVPLLGYCVAENDRFLIYKHMPLPNGNLHDQLHAPKNVSGLSEWPLRLKVAIGAARGLAWLHHNCNPCIIHRNISSKCILLDKDFEPRISEFGLARLMDPVDTHLSTAVNGEFGHMGYVAPEYLRPLAATPKGDVYSFGVVLLELITRERATFVSRAPESFKGNLVEWVLQMCSNSKSKDAIDRSLVGKGVDHELLQFLKVAKSCVSLEPKERPSMFEIYQLLRAIGEPYHFSYEGDFMLQSDADDINDLKELIVVRDETRYT